MDILILGAGVRAAAFSALRAGLRPTCGDLFADRDLAEACQVERVDPAGYPDDLLGLANRLPPGPWMYTGALENRPDLIAAVSARHRLLGCSPDAVRAVRDPVELARVARAAGLPAPQVTLDPRSLPVDGSWLIKPLASAGGHGIRPWLGPGTGGGPAYYQERVLGRSLSATFLADPGGAHFVGLTRQFIGRAGHRFAYRGTLAPWPASPRLLGRVERLGRAIGSAFGLVGLFGVDLVEADDEAWPIEVNPRYSASAEILEWTLGRSLLAEHVKACGEAPGEIIGPGRLAEPVAAKAILFATRDCEWPRFEGALSVDPGRYPEVADIPWPGTRFRPGRPVATAFASARTAGACRRALATRLRVLRRRLIPIKPGC